MYKYIYIYIYVCMYIHRFSSSIKNLIVFYLAAKGMGSGDRSAILSILIAKLPRKLAEILEWLDKKPVAQKPHIPYYPNAGNFVD